MPVKKTALMEAVSRGWMDKVKELLAGNADVNETDPLGATALMSAQTAEMAKLLRAAGADIHACDKYGSTVLMKTLAYPEVVRVLLDNGADPDVRNEAGDTALIWCGRWGHAASASLLAVRGAKQDIENKAGETLQSVIDESGHGAVARALEEAVKERQRLDRRQEQARHAESAARQQRLKEAAPRLRFGG